MLLCALKMVGHGLLRSYSTKTNTTMKKYTRSLILLFGILLIGCQSPPKKDKKLKQTTSKDDILKILTKVNDKWQAEHDVANQNAFWHPAAYHIGNVYAYQLTQDKQQLNYTIQWAENNQWSGAKSTTPDQWKFTYGETDEYVLFGDWQACFQVYIDLYHMAPQDIKIARAKEVMHYQVNTAENGYWWWIDGLFMVMPVMTRMYGLTQDPIYLEKLHEYYSYTKQEVFDEASGLFYRDAKYIYPKHTTNSGKKDFWARGNGWVFAALARTLEGLPKSNPYYSEYVAVFKQMATALKNAQHKDGYWTRSLLDEHQAPGPETSGTAFFTFGILWGLNNGILNQADYATVVERSWTYLSKTAIQNDHTLGYVQPIGENAMPGQTVNQNSTSDFGVGAFLLAATEMAKFIDLHHN